MTYLITFLDNNVKSAVYTGVNIHGIHDYLEIIGSPTKCTTSGKRSYHFGPSYSINNYTETLQPFIADLRMRQKNIFKLCGSIWHKADSCIIHGPKFLPPSIKINIIHFNTLHGEEPNNPPNFGTENLHKINSNPEPLLPTPALWFQISWGGLIIITLIMVMFRFTL